MQIVGLDYLISDLYIRTIDAGRRGDMSVTLLVN